MPRPRYPNLYSERTRHGRTVWYVRIGKGPRTRLRAEYGSQEFIEQYQASISGKAISGPPKAAAGTLQWLYERYRETGAWRDLSQATRRQRELIFAQVLKTAAADKYVKITQKHIAAGRDRRSKTPAQARHFIDAMRGLFRWALESEHVKIDPTAGVKNPAKTKGGGFPVWTEADVERYEKKWKVGTRERVWLDVLLYTGLRRGDAVRLGPQHITDGIATIQTEKSRFEITVTLPILPVLQETLDAGPLGDATFISGERGKRLTKEAFGNMFRDACRLAGVDKSAHGVRKIGATRAAENGATVSELEAVFGWRGGGMASLYTKAADRVRLSKGAMGKLTRRPAPAIPGAGNASNTPTKSDI